MKSKLLLFMMIGPILTSSYASEKAKVLIVRGAVTKLLPGSHGATEVKKGDLLPEDTSLVTKERSFIRLRLQDKSTINLGPKSKMVISLLPRKKANVVNLLTGMIQAEVNKRVKKKTKNKLVVKTASAVLGIRGTKFQSTFNPLNKATSLVTVEGKVAMVKATDETIGRVDPELLDKALAKSSKVVEVPAGRYSGVVQKISKPTVPVKISPTQYNALAKNMGSKKTAEEALKTLSTDAKPEGFLNKSTGQYAPRAGGLVDFSTGIYVPPLKESKLNKGLGVFESKEIGKVNKATGDYIPPKGVRIDSKKGFIVDVKEGDQIARSDAKAKVALLNDEVQEQVNLHEADTDKVDSSWFSRFLPRNHKVSFEIIPTREELEVERHGFQMPNLDDHNSFSADSNLILISWMHEWNDKWSSRIRLGGGDYEFDSADYTLNHGPDQDTGSSTDDIEYFSVGVSYKLNEKFSFSFDIVERTETYILLKSYDIATSGGDLQQAIEFRVDDISLIDFGVDYNFYNYKKFRFSSELIYHMFEKSNAPRESFSGNDSPENADAYGFTGSIVADYRFSSTLNFVSTLWYRRIEVDGEDFEYKRKAGGLGLKLVWDI